MARRKVSKKQVASPTPRKPTAEQLLLLQELSGLFNRLRAIHDVMIVCIDASLTHNSDTETEVSAVLRTYASNPLFGQLSLLTKIIESLGGTTCLSVEDKA